MTLRKQAWLRSLLAGPGAFVAAVVLMCGAALYLPQGAAGVNNLVLPAVLFPLLWTAGFLYALLDPSLARAGLVMLAVSLANTAFIAAHLLTRIPS